LRFLLDMGISVKVFLWLNNKGYDAIDLSSLGLHTLPDIEIVKKARAEERIILTSDMDFGHLLAFTKLSTISVVQFRTSNFTAAYIIEKLELLLDKFPDQLKSGYLITVEDGKIRLRKLPI
jgi:predicted nuclease of predicted toxin-antitoxin system